MCVWGGACGEGELQGQETARGSWTTGAMSPEEEEEEEAGKRLLLLLAIYLRGPEEE